MIAKGKTNKQIHGHNRRLAEAALYDFLEKIKYKGAWYRQDVIEIGQYEPSTTICYNCGNKIDKLDVSIRKWKCPKCGSENLRDYNAAKVIERKALEKLNME